MNDGIYQPLPVGTKTVRLLSLQPSAEFAAPVSGTLKVADLEHQPVYETISLYWGEPPSTGSITLDCVRAIVPQNLEDALRHFHLSGQPRRLWVDAVCIH